jgi:hypothetical protein
MRWGPPKARVEFSICDSDALSSALYFAGPARYAGIRVHNSGFLALKAGYFLQFKYGDGA